MDFAATKKNGNISTTEKHEIESNRYKHPCALFSTAINFTLRYNYYRNLYSCVCVCFFCNFSVTFLPFICIKLIRNMHNMYCMIKINMNVSTISAPTSLRTVHSLTHLIQMRTVFYSTITTTWCDQISRPYFNRSLFAGLCEMIISFYD